MIDIDLLQACFYVLFKFFFSHFLFIAILCLIAGRNISLEENLLCL